MQITWICLMLLDDDIHNIFAFKKVEKFTFLVQNL